MANPELEKELKARKRDVDRLKDDFGKLREDASKASSDASERAKAAADEALDKLRGEAETIGEFADLAREEAESL